MSNGDVTIDPPYRLDPLQNIINVRWATIYLYVSIFAGNERAGKGGPNPIPAVDPPYIHLDPDPAAAATPKSSIKLLDQRHTPQSLNGPSSCMQYEPEQTGVVGFGPPYDLGTLRWSDPIFGPVGTDPQTAYDQFSGGVPSPVTHVSAPVNGACSMDIVQFEVASEFARSSTESRDMTWYVNLVWIPINYISEEQLVDEYLYKIHAADDLLSVTISGLLDNEDGPPIQEGGANIYVSVYSRARQDVTKLSDLIDYAGDGVPRIDPDDSCQVLITWLPTSTTTGQGTFKINVRLDKDPADKQTDNYGFTYQPYKVTFDPPDKSTDYPPQQPPTQLPLPGKP